MVAAAKLKHPTAHKCIDQQKWKRAVKKASGYSQILRISARPRAYFALIRTLTKEYRLDCLTLTDFDKIAAKFNVVRLTAQGSDSEPHCDARVKGTERGRRPVLIR